MGQIKIEIVMYEGQEGAPIDKLGTITERIDVFLRSLGKDVGLDIPKGEWIATDFKDGSFKCNVLHAGGYDIDGERAFNRGVTDVNAIVVKRKRPNGKYSAETIRSFAAIAEPLDIGEKIGFGIYERNGDKPKKLPDLTKVQATEILTELDRSVQYVGTVYGAIQTLYKGAKPKMSFSLTEYLSQKRILCKFKDAIYDDVITALKRPQAIVYVYGAITSNKISREIKEMEIEGIQLAPELSDEEYERFFGCAPDITGDVSTEDYIEQARSYDRDN